MRKGKRKDHSSMTDTLIGAETTVEGQLISKASLRIEGRVNGDVDCSGDITIGENGIAHSNMNARNVILAGTANGSVTCKGSLTITATGRMIGNVSVGSLIVMEGATFQGSSKMEKADLRPVESANAKNQEHKQQEAADKKSAAG